MENSRGGLCPGLDYEELLKGEEDVLVIIQLKIYELKDPVQHFKFHNRISHLAADIKHIKNSNRNKL